MANGEISSLSQAWDYLLDSVFDTATQQIVVMAAHLLPTPQKLGYLHLILLANRDPALVYRG